MLITIITALLSFVDSSAFATALHALLTDLGATSSEPQLDSMAQAASDLLKSGMSFEQTAASVAADYKVPAHHAAVVTAAAVAQNAKTA